MLNQVELELEMYAFGRARANRMMTKNEEQGRANNNPYASAVYRRFILPLAAVIQEDLDDKKPGRRKAYVKLLEALDPEAVAYLAVRHTLNALMNQSDANLRGVMTAVGRACYHELCLALFEHEDPALFHTLVTDFGRRMSKSERHRMTVFKMQARERGITVPEWGPQGVQQVGAYLLEHLAQLEMVEITPVQRSAGRSDLVRNGYDFRLHPDVFHLISELKAYAAESMPYFLPCIEKPRDWTSISDGGFHTREMRRLMPYAIRAKANWSDLAEYDLGKPLAAINKLQSVAWQVNSEMLDAIRNVARHFDMDEILSQAEFPAPPAPEWLAPDMTSENMTEVQKTEFKHWKRQKADWFTQMKLRGTKYGRFYTATSIADKFRNFPNLYFVYFADFRGRLYAQTTGISPQGSDLQKALIRFANGKPITTKNAERWFYVHGANKWGYDKESLDDRVKWVKDRHDLLIGFAEDPIGNRDWRDADCPLQFLAWCFEYRRYHSDPDFKSHIPIGMDGSCNGLQNFSAMLRDEVGGRATNLVPGAKPSDIYQMVADVTTSRLQAVEEDEGNYRNRWLSHGISRSLVKRSVMTLPYGSTRFSCADFIVGDYMKLGKAEEFAKEEYRHSAQYLSHYVWDSIGDVVVKAREAMSWLQASARSIIRDGAEEIVWVTPTGFPVIQLYWEQESHRIRTNLCGNAFLRVNVEQETADINRHKNGIAPNFVHSYDASHLTVVTVDSPEDMDLAMIHDDYGTHAADAQALYDLIRVSFVNLYADFDPLKDFQERYQLKTDPPAKGTLDLNCVLESPYFFS
ncbi:RNA polymerase [Caulobacter phage Lullwater]|uniref:DNA-directed RNA polymerase n=1 Tax=Caulobacter phage Lullwater TaxID=2024607 RepID=A0A291LBB2_9CAUD|nr:RNA polymerase [Caulobacter phage Lullwater]ATI16335.1 DNA-directed RNA polymerase [Caulobacter phage Lullwater]